MKKNRRITLSDDKREFLMYINGQKNQSPGQKNSVTSALANNSYVDGGIVQIHLNELSKKYWNSYKNRKQLII